jgi:hypothetical protein
MYSCIHVLHGSVTPIPSLKPATDSHDLKVGNKSIKAQHFWHRSVDKKHSFLHVKIEAMFVIFFFFARKSMPHKK